ncbi:hypothetical protein G9F72_006565 [Clostridium estertheticum]|uniref:hypothetical protein n=1 Tax=Clostridium estertheticum TaxID=238834 RepID=UPI0013E9669D|nr:hypothetical protein [Clostridium estertheticum]MBZ9685997.1 hypothetical protein [Clostridium estertheticum]
MSNARAKVIDEIKNRVQDLNLKQVTIGIDAFIDKIQRVVKSQTEERECVFFNDIGEFGAHLITKKGMSCGIEVRERFTKLGGNAPIMANALGSLGVKLNCVAAMGYPEIQPIFKEISYNCTLHTIANPGYTTALEFNDGKIMLSQREELLEITWSSLKNLLGMEKLNEFICKGDLVGLVNWNGIKQSNSIFRGILQDVLPTCAPSKVKVIFFDLADCSERSKEDICEAIDLIRQFGDYFKVILGLNENETNLVYKALKSERGNKDLLTIGDELYKELKIDALVVHTHKSSIAWHKDGRSQISSLFVQKPKLSTGGGDNFNAGLCFGQLLGLNFESSMYIANATSGYYVRNGKSPSIDNLIQTLVEWDDLMEQ